MPDEYKPWDAPQAEFQGYMRAKMENVESELANGREHFKTIEIRCESRRREIDFNRLVVKVVVWVTAISGAAIITTLITMVLKR